MAHYARLGADGVVLEVVVIDDQHEVGGEAAGIAWCEQFFGTKGWIKTSYNGKIRGNFAGIGMTYNAKLDVFVPVKIYQSWVWDFSKNTWVPPVPYPTDGQVYIWNETGKIWVEAK